MESIPIRPGDYVQESCLSTCPVMELLPHDREQRLEHLQNLIRRGCAVRCSGDEPTAAVGQRKCGLSNTAKNTSAQLIIDVVVEAEVSDILDAPLAAVNTV